MNFRCKHDVRKKSGLPYLRSSFRVFPPFWTIISSICAGGPAKISKNTNKVGKNRYLQFQVTFSSTTRPYTTNTAQGLSQKHCFFGKILYGRTARRLSTGILETQRRFNDLDSRPNSSCESTNESTMGTYSTFSTYSL